MIKLCLVGGFMTNSDLRWMKYSIELADNVKNHNFLHVGAVLTNDDKLIYSASSENINSLSWLQSLLLKLDNKETHMNSLYLTINTISGQDSFDLNELLKSLIIENIYIGMPDPAIDKYIQNDPVIRLNNINRYPDDLQKRIIKQNLNFYQNSKQNIAFIPYYASTRISNLVVKKLNLTGVPVSKEDIETHKNFNELTNYIADKFLINLDKAKELVNIALSEAFNEKYSSYDYNNDVRSVNCHWLKDFKSIIKTLFNESLDDKKIINVGVGSGSESMTIFSSHNKITFVDIAKQGLMKIKKQMPYSKIVCTRAEDLSQLSSNTYDLYISLRTYNSSFFDVKTALYEAYRVLKNNGKLIISISNGFLCPQQNRILSGLIIPNTDFIDIYRGFNLIKVLAKECEQQGFTNIKIKPTNTEIYLMAEAKK